MTGLITMISAIFVIKALSRIRKFKKLVQNLKDKLMWSSVFRSQIQTYFPTALATVGMMNGVRKNLEDGRRLQEVNYTELITELNFENMSSIVGKLGLLVFLPVFSYFYLKKNRESLAEDRF